MCTSRSKAPGAGALESVRENILPISRRSSAHFTEVDHQAVLFGCGHERGLKRFERLERLLPQKIVIRIFD